MITRTTAKHWIFDLDGTLVDTVEHYFEKIRRIFDHFGLPCTDGDLERAGNYFNAREFFALYLPEEKLGEAQSLLNKLSIELAPLAKPFHGVTDLLHDLQSCGVHISLWTGRDFASTEKILDHTGLKPYFRSLVSGTCVTKKKPDPEGIFKLLDMTGFAGADSVMVGDHLCDMQGAKASGVKALSVSWLKPAPHPLESFSDVHFYQVSDLHAWATSSS